MNSFQKKPYNPNIKKIFPTIVAPTFEDDNNKLAQLFILIEQGNIAEVKKHILTTRVKINAIYNDESVLHKVLMIDDIKMSESKKLDFIIYLVSNGALINAYNKYNITPLHFAVQKKYLSIVKYFIQKNANVNSVTNENLTPLHYATLINIDSCPSDYSPQNIIDINEKNINYNKITNIIIEAFKKNKDLQISNIDINSNDYQDDGSLVINKYTFTNTNFMDSIKNNKYITYLQELIKIIPDIDSIVKTYNDTFRTAAQSNSINPNNLNKDMTEQIIKSEIKKLKKKLTINKNIDAIIENSEKIDNNKYTINSIKVNYSDKLKYLLLDIDEFIENDLSELFKYIIISRLEDNNDIANIIASKKYNLNIKIDKTTNFDSTLNSKKIDKLYYDQSNPNIPTQITLNYNPRNEKYSYIDNNNNNYNLDINIDKNEIQDILPLGVPGPRGITINNINVDYNYFSYYFIFLNKYNEIKGLSTLKPRQIYELLYVLLVIHTHVSSKLLGIDELNNILNKIENKIKDLIEKHNSIIKDCIIQIIIMNLQTNNSTSNLQVSNLQTIKLDNFDIDMEQKFDLNKFEIINQITDGVIKQNYLKKLIDKNYFEYIISNFLKDIRNKYYFFNQTYYNNAIEELQSVIISGKTKNKIVRESIYKMYDTIILDYFNNLIGASIITNITTNIGTTTKLGSPILQGLVDIYLPNKEYTFNFYTYTNNIINFIINTKNKIELDNYSKSNKITNNLQNSYDFKIIEDEDYDIYNDKNFSSDVITIEKLNKYYPIFYSYNYDGQEVNKECLIINYDLIEFLLKSGANVNIKDQTGKTVLDYIVDGKMHYILNDDTEYIKKRLVKNNLQYILEKIIKNELEHNNLFGYTNNKIKLLENYEKTFIDKLKNTEEIKNNIPLNIKYIFKIYLLLQNIYWHRMLNKEFYVDNTYAELFDIKYTSNNKTTLNNDWKNIISDINFDIKLNSEVVIDKKINKLMKSTTIIEGMGYDKELLKQAAAKSKAPYSREYKLNKDKKKALEKIKKKLLDTPLVSINDTSLNYGDYFNNIENITADKSILYFRKIFKNLVDFKTTHNYYTYIWKLINDFDKPYFIHLKMCEIYDKILQKPVINNIKKQTYSAISLIKQQHNIKLLDNDKIDELNIEISKLIKYMEPISKFIDGRMYEPVLSNNPLLLFQIRTIIHILTTFIGSNMIMFLSRLLFIDYNNILEIGKTNNDINKKINEHMEDVKEYVLSDLLIDGKLSYEFVKLIKPFKIIEYDLPKENNMEEIFEKIIEKLRLDDKIHENLIINIKTKVLPYYQSLYKEVTVQLFNFSDSYYRFIKNQYAGLLMINKCC